MRQTKTTIDIETTHKACKMEDLDEGDTFMWPTASTTILMVTDDADHAGESICIDLTNGYTDSFLGHMEVIPVNIKLSVELV